MAVTSVNSVAEVAQRASVFNPLGGVLGRIVPCIRAVGKDGGIYSIAVDLARHTGSFDNTIVVSAAREGATHGVSDQAAHLSDTFDRAGVCATDFAVFSSEPCVFSKESDDATHLVDAADSGNGAVIGRGENLAVVQKGTYDAAHIARVGRDIGIVLTPVDDSLTDTGTRNTAGIIA